VLSRLLFAALLLWTLLAAAAHAEMSPDAALAELLADARAAATPVTCAEAGADRLIRIFCAGRIRIGVRDHYPLFATHTAGVRRGYEIDVARLLGERLGVAVDFVKVKAATRIPMLADGSIDLAIATMGDNTQREREVRFIRPHYYRSQTILIGRRDAVIESWRDLAGRTVCVTIGNGSNAELVSRGARLMLFDDASQLPKRLRDETCTLAAQDDSFFATYFLDAAFAARFSEKFGFGEVPWGMGVARDGSARLARALDLASQVFHRDRVFLVAARAHRVHTEFLETQRQVWTQAECNTASGSTNSACVLPGANAELQPTSFAAGVAALEAWVSRLTGLHVMLPMLKTAPAWSLFLNGAANSLLLVAGALAFTLASAVAFGFAMSSAVPLLRWPAHTVTVVLQSSPIVLTLVVTAAVMHALLPYTPTMALAAAVLALGLTNGANAGQAIAEAYVTLRHEDGADDSRSPLFPRALSRASTQIIAFLINAAKGTPIASFIGAPELLGALTDITSFSSGRETTYTLLLAFYIAVVGMVVWLCRRVQRVLEPRMAATA
jgi:polar amino acid transport system substrate-binding protein